MAKEQQGYSRGIQAPRESASLDKVFNLSTFKEGAMAGYNIDWTQQESTVFQTLANVGSELVETWRTLNQERKALAYSEVEEKYKKQMEEVLNYADLIGPEAFKTMVGDFSYSGGWGEPLNRPWMPGNPAGGEE